MKASLKGTGKEIASGNSQSGVDSHRSVVARRPPRVVCLRLAPIARVIRDRARERLTSTPGNVWVWKTVRAESHLARSVWEPNKADGDHLGGMLLSANGFDTGTLAAVHQPQILPVPRRRNALARRVGPRRVAAGRDPELAPLDDVPVLPVREVPELDRVLDVALGSASVSGMEEPLRLDHGAVRRRPGAPGSSSRSRGAGSAAGSASACSRRRGAGRRSAMSSLTSAAARAAAHGGALVRRLDLHVAAEERRPR